MDRFVTKSSVDSGEKSSDHNGSNYDKEYDAKKGKRNFQLSFSWLALAWHLPKDKFCEKYLSDPAYE